MKLTLVGWLGFNGILSTQVAAIEDLHANSSFRRIILYAAILGAKFLTLE